MNGLVLKIESCRDCPRFIRRQVKHWTFGREVMYEFKCTKANKIITRQDGIEPPPTWCPIRNQK